MAQGGRWLEPGTAATARSSAEDRPAQGESSERSQLGSGSWHRESRAGARRRTGELAWQGGDGWAAGDRAHGQGTPRQQHHGAGGTTAAGTTLPSTGLSAAMAARRPEGPGALLRRGWEGARPRPPSAAPRRDAPPRALLFRHAKTISTCPPRTPQGGRTLPHQYTQCLEPPPARRGPQRWRPRAWPSAKWSQSSSKASNRWSRCRAWARSGTVTASPA